MHGVYTQNIDSFDGKFSGSVNNHRLSFKGGNIIVVAVVMAYENHICMSLGWTQAYFLAEGIQKGYDVISRSSSGLDGHFEAGMAVIFYDHEYWMVKYITEKG